MQHQTCKSTQYCNILLFKKKKRKEKKRKERLEGRKTYVDNDWRANFACVIFPTITAWGGRCIIGNGAVASIKNVHVIDIIKLALTIKVSLLTRTAQFLSYQRFSVFCLLVLFLAFFTYDFGDADFLALGRAQVGGDQLWNFAPVVRRSVQENLNESVEAARNTRR